MGKYINIPGSVVLQLANGDNHTALYGEDISGLDLAEHVDTSPFTDEHPRLSQSELLRRAAAERSALSQSSQTSANVIPGTYSELSEEAASQYMRKFADEPGAQAQLIEHELLHAGGRQLVIDSATPAARAQVAALIEGDEPEADEASPVPPAPVPPANVQTPAAVTPPAPAGAGAPVEDDLSDKSYDDLKAVIDAEELDIPKSGSKADLATAIREARSAK